MKKVVLTVLLALALAASPAETYAASQLQVVAEDSLWGALIGALVGTAALAFRDHPGDHLDLISRGAAVGLVCVLAFGLYEISPVFYGYRDPVTKETLYAMGVRVPIR